MRFPEGFQAPSQATIDRVNNPATFVVAMWNGIPADNSAKRSVWYLTEHCHHWHGINRWSCWRSEAQQFTDEAEAEAALAAIKLGHLREVAKVHPNMEAHVRTGGLPGKELA